jgi:hypothetical protein
MALLMLNLGARSGWVVNATTRPLHPRETAPLPIVDEAKRAPGPVSTGMVKRESLSLKPRTVQPIASCYNDYAVLAPVHEKDS